MSARGTRAAARHALVAGADTVVPVRRHGRAAARRYVHLDNAASTPPLRSVLERVVAFADWYANVHRGAGFKSRLSTHAYEAARAAVGRFVGADPAHDVVVFTRSTTEALNQLAARWPLAPGAVVLTTAMEHHSNDLPWRRVACVEHVEVLPDGRLDEDDLRARLRRHRGRVALLAVTGASNVTGRVNPVHAYARLVHEAGARIVVDAAQLAPHRPLDVRAADDPEHLDAVAFSAHKLYAPFGAGALVAPAALLAGGAPYQVGGGTVDSVRLDDVAWAALPEREEAGTPPVIGAVALAAALETYTRLGWPAIRRHETTLAAHLRAALRRVPGLTILGDDAPDAPANDATPERLGVVAFTLAGVPHGLVAAILAHEWAIGTRHGCFCAHPYLHRLLGLAPDAVRHHEAAIARGDRGDLPGAVRVSLGLQNTRDEVDRLARALAAVAAGDHRRDYVLDRAHGTWEPPEGDPCYDRYLRSLRP